jgi:hypothetical protein
MRSRTELAAVWPPTAEAAREAKHEPVSPLRAIRAKCLDCCCGQISEVRRCEAVSCPLWPFRAGRHPWHSLAGKSLGNPASNEQGEAIGEEAPDG